MVWLNAMLAFTLAMIIFCTMVSAMTELVQRVVRMRAKGLEQMLGRLFDTAIWPRVAATFQGTASAAEVRTSLIAALTRNQAVQPTTNVPQLDSLSVIQFAERLEVQFVRSVGRGADTGKDPAATEPEAKRPLPQTPAEVSAAVVPATGAPAAVRVPLSPAGTPYGGRP